MMTLKDGKRFNDTAAYAACKAAEAQYKQAANLGSVAWNTVYSTEAELIGTVKEHTTYYDTKQTVLTRCRIIGRY